MQVTSIHILRLGLLMMSVGTITLGTALLIVYRNSARLPHVLPLAIAYIWTSLVVSARGWNILGFEAALWNCLGAYVVGNVGLLVLLFRPWPRPRP